MAWPVGDAPPWGLPASPRPEALGVAAAGASSQTITSSLMESTLICT